VARGVTIAVFWVEPNLPVGFDALRNDAHCDGHSRMERLAADWATGVNRFAAAGEALFSASAAGELAGIVGMTIDGVDTAAMRMRRFYVRPGFRRHGVGCSLADVLLAQARRVAHRVLLNATTELAVRFWEAIGLVPDRRDGHRHVLRWPSG